jgi:TRAP-type C4-dicarboxylate transport system substrate-binding protein
MQKRASLLILSVLAAACATAPQAPPAPRTIRIVTPFASGHLLAETAARFRDELQKTAPHITVTVQAGVLNEQTIDPAMQACAAGERVGEIMITGGQPIQDWAPQYFFFNGPYVIRDFAHLQRVWNGPLGQAMSQQLEANGKLVSFAPVYRGYRQFTSNKPINTPADFNGLKLRLPPTPDWISVWQSLGVTAVQVPLPGIYDALKSGAAGASEGDLTQIQSLKLNEVQSQLTLTNHLVGFGMQMANACFFRKELTQGEREKVAAALARAAEWGTRTSQEREASTIAQLKAGGMSVNTPDAAAIRKAAEPAINQLFANKWTVTTWQKVLAQ